MALLSDESCHDVVIVIGIIPEPLLLISASISRVKEVPWTTSVSLHTPGVRAKNEVESAGRLSKQ